MTMKSTFFLAVVLAHLFCGIGMTCPAGDNPDPCFIKHLTVYTVPADRERLRVGVCEEVNLTAPAVAKWTVTGGGTLSFSTAVSTTFYAPKDPGTSTIKAVIGNRSCTVVFTVVKPEGVTMTAAAPFYHISAIPSAGFTGTNIVLSPGDVSFRGILVKESEVSTGTGTGVFHSLNGVKHPEGTARAVKDGNIVDSQGDQVFSKGSTAAVNGDYSGEYSLSIPWKYNCHGGTFVLMFDVLHHSLSDKAGKTTTDKANANAAFNRNDPSQGF